MTAQERLKSLTEAVQDAQHKPMLRAVLEAELLKFGHDEPSVTAALDDFYKVAVQ